MESFIYTPCVGIHISQRFCHIACTEEGLARLLQHADRTKLLVLEHLHHLPKPNSPGRIFSIEKARKMAYFRAFLAFLSCRLSLAELRCATSCFEAVFKQYFCLFPCIFKAFQAPTCRFPLRVNPSKNSLIVRYFDSFGRLNSLPWPAPRAYYT